MLEQLPREDIIRFGLHCLEYVDRNINNQAIVDAIDACKEWLEAHGGDIEHDYRVSRPFDRLPVRSRHCEIGSAAIHRCLGGNDDGSDGSDDGSNNIAHDILWAVAWDLTHALRDHAAPGDQQRVCDDFRDYYMRYLRLLCARSDAGYRDETVSGLADQDLATMLDYLYERNEDIVVDTEDGVKLNTPDGTYGIEAPDIGKLTEAIKGNLGVWRWLLGLYRRTANESRSGFEIALDEAIIKQPIPAGTMRDVFDKLDRERAVMYLYHCIELSKKYVSWPNSDKYLEFIGRWLADPDSVPREEVRAAHNDSYTNLPSAESAVSHILGCMGSNNQGVSRHADAAISYISVRVHTSTTDDLADEFDRDCHRYLNVLHHVTDLDDPVVSSMTGELGVMLDYLDERGEDIVVPTENGVRLNIPDDTYRVEAPDTGALADKIRDDPKLLRWIKRLYGQKKAQSR